MKSTRIAFISPRSNFFFHNEEKNKILKQLTGFEVHEHYWSGLGPALTTLSALTPDEFEIEIIDENIEEIDYARDYIMVAVSAMTPQAIRAYQICAEFKKRNIFTVIGGLHPSFMPQEAINYAHSVVRGEAENIWPNLIKDLKQGKLKKIYDSMDYSPVNLSEIPIPRYDLLKNKDYKILWLNTTRGCVYDCEFCTATRFFGKKQRYKNLEQVCDEINFINQHFKRILIGFGDNNMFINRKHSYSLIKHFFDLNFNWVAQSDISIGKDSDFLKFIFKAGCRALLIGFESLDKENLESIYKKGTRKLKSDYLDRYEKLVNNIQSHGIGIWGSFVSGLDNDTKETFDRIIDFVKRTHMLGAHVTVLTPLPGTRLRERIIREKRLLPTSWDNYTLADLNFIPKNMTEKDIEQGVIKAFKQIFSKQNRIEVTKYFKAIMKKIYKEQGI